MRRIDPVIGGGARTVPNPLAKKQGLNERIDGLVEEPLMPESKAEERFVDEVLVVVAAPKSVVAMDWQNRALSATG